MVICWHYTSTTVLVPQFLRRSRWRELLSCLEFHGWNLWNEVLKSVCSLKWKRLPVDLWSRPQTSFSIWAWYMYISFRGHLWNLLQEQLLKEAWPSHHPFPQPKRFNSTFSVVRGKILLEAMVKKVASSQLVILIPSDSIELICLSEFSKLEASVWFDLSSLHAEIRTIFRLKYILGWNRGAEFGTSQQWRSERTTNIPEKWQPSQSVSALQLTDILYCEFEWWTCVVKGSGIISAFTVSKGGFDLLIWDIQFFSDFAPEQDK